jgi:DNA-binding transcriptional regulator YiaG
MRATARTYNRKKEAAATPTNGGSATPRASARKEVVREVRIARIIEADEHDSDSDSESEVDYELAPTAPRDNAVTAIRERLDLTQQDFATMLGFATVSVSRWEHERTRPTDLSKMLIQLLERACDATDPERVVATLRTLVGAEDVDRVLALAWLVPPPAPVKRG